MVKEGVLNNPKVDIILGYTFNAQTKSAKSNTAQKEPLHSDWFTCK
jgi:hypothetical protein